MPEVDLQEFDDSVLSTSLRMLFEQHEAASDAGNTTECAEIHHAITAIVDEQARRTDEWIEAKRDAMAGQPQQS